MNDPIEYQRLKAYHSHTLFAACFTYSDVESPPMWLIYAKGNLGIKLGFDNIDFFKSTDNYYINNPGDFSQNEWKPVHSCILDVLYADEPLTRPRDVFGEDSSPVIEPDATGFAKTTMWEYEKETRALFFTELPCLLIPNEMERARQGLDSVIPIKTHDEYRPDFGYVYCTIQDSAIENMTITFNPFMDQPHKDIIKAVVTKYYPNFNNFLNSEIEGQINLV